MNIPHQIACAAQLESLPVIRNFIDSVCSSEPGIDEQFIYDIKLAVDEACTNIITHGYAGMDPGSIIVFLERDARQVKITITDFGHSFEPNEAPMPDVEAGLEDQPTGGFGLYFIYQSMDQVDYEADYCGNRLILVKKLEPVKHLRDEEI